MQNNLKNKQVLVFGGSGFLGSAVISELSKTGASVTSVSRKEYDILKSDDSILEKYVKDKDIIINLAAVVNSHDKEASTESRAVNVDFPKKLYEVTKKNNPKAKIIFSSSQTVYGESPDELDETHKTKPVSVYARQKLEAENIFKRHKNVIILRFSNIYGPNSPTDRSLISKFIEQARSNKDITLFGFGEELRDYIYIDDAAKAVVHAASLEHPDKIYNVGSGTLLSPKQIAQQVILKMNKGKIVYTAFPESYTRYKGDLKINSSRFRKDADWEPLTDFVSGLDKCIKKQ